MKDVEIKGRRSNRRSIREGGLVNFVLRANARF